MQFFFKYVKESNLKIEENKRNIRKQKISLLLRRNLVLLYNKDIVFFILDAQLVFRSSIL